MAVSENSIQALEVLNQITARAASGREADKSRAMRIMEMKIASDENEAQRLNTYLGSLRTQNAALEQEYVKATGLQRSMDALSTESDYAGSGEGGAIAAQKRSTIAMDRSGLRQQIAEAEAEQDDTFGRLSMYYEAYNRLAPEQFERYVAAGKDKTLSGISTIGDDEWNMIKADLKAGGIELTAEREAGLKKALNALGKQRFDQEYKERVLNLRSQELSLRARAAAAKGKGLDPRDLMAQLREKILRTNETAKSFEVKDQIDLAIPLSAQTTAIETAVSAARSAAAFLSKDSRVDRSGPAFGLFKDTPDEIIDLVDNFKKSSGEARNMAAMRLMEKLSQNRDLITEGFDYTGLGSSSEAASGEPSFVGDLVDVYDTAMWFETQTPVSQPAGFESVTYGINAKETGRPPQTGNDEPGFVRTLLDAVVGDLSSPRVADPLMRETLKDEQKNVTVPFLFNK